MDAAVDQPDATPVDVGSFTDSGRAGTVPDHPETHEAAVRLIYPLSTVAVTSARPRLRWVASPDLNAFTVRICADRACSQIEQTIQTAQHEVRPVSDLSPGPHFWRVEASQGGETETSFTWLFRVIVGRSTLDTFFDGGADFNGDGLSDLMAHDLMTGRVYVFYGTRERRLRRESSPLDSIFGVLTCRWGDVNGDGLSDAFLGRRDSDSDVYSLYTGTSEGLRPTSAEYRNPAQEQLSGFIGDPNGDGRGEWIFTIGRGVDGNLMTIRLQMYGSTLRTLPGPIFPDDVAGIAPPSDLDGDGLADIVTGMNISGANDNRRLFWGGPTFGDDPGQRVAGLGTDSVLRIDSRCDFDADGRLDVAISDSDETFPSQAQAQCVLFLQCAGLDATPPS
jgi:FG-GAP-like repeat